MENIKELKEILNKKISASQKILIVPHILPDFDALGSAVGLVKICNKLNKESYILIDDDYSTLDKSVNRMILEIQNTYNVINLNDYLALINNNDLLITTDVNKDHLIAIREHLESFRNKIIIDHHLEDDHTINADYKYINPNISSASEIVATLLKNNNVKYDGKCATYLYAGIILDTNNLKKNITKNTFTTIAKLLEKGANISYVNSLFMEDFERDRKIHELINYSQFINLSYAIAAGKDKIYSKEDLAKTADYILKYNVDAAFAIGLISESQVGISGRSNGKINVGKVLKELGGGGNIMSAAAKINDNNIEEIEKKLKLVLVPNQHIEII